MKPLLCLAAAAVLCLPALAHGQKKLPQTDVEYCGELIDLYTRYVGGYEFSGRGSSPRNDTEARVAIAKCRAGDTVSGIPVLERKLTDSKINLPKRD